jgi:hypothetical protein
MKDKVIFLGGEQMLQGFQDGVPVRYIKLISFSNVHLKIKTWERRVQL